MYSPERLTAYDFFNIFLDFCAGKHHLPAAFDAFDFKIHTDSQDEKVIFATRVAFFHLQNIAYLNIQKNNLLSFP